MEEIRIPHTSRVAHLASSPLFQPVPNEDAVSKDDLINLSYRRAQAIGRAYAFSSEDVLLLSNKFWEMHMDKICILDGSATTLLTIQYNLAAGTLAPHALRRPELRGLMQKILNFDVSAQFMLTELAHGLDALNLETTATCLPNGEFDLNTPHPRAAKFMPPNGPYGGIPRVAIVFARLIVNEEDRGIRPFIVALSDGMSMCKGVTSRMLPTRTGTKPLDHAITYFNHVRLPPQALLGSLNKPSNFRADFLKSIWRVSVGTLALSCLAVPLMATVPYVVAQYSHQRTVTGSDGNPQPLWSFRTQQLPVIHALAQYWVLKSYAEEAISIFKDISMGPFVQHGIATTLKAVMTQHSQTSLFRLTERCGAQGLFTHTQILQTQVQMRGVGIAEGDVLVLCIRLATELLLGRYEMPKPRHPNCLLARHESGLFDQYRTIAGNLERHRSEGFNRKILPICQPLVEAIGHRMAYEAAFDAGVDRALLDVYEAGVIVLDSGWYVEHAGLNHRRQLELEEEAVTRALPRLDQLLKDTETTPFVTAPILSEERWFKFVNDLEFCNGESSVDIYLQTQWVSPSDQQQITVSSRL